MLDWNEDISQELQSKIKEQLQKENLLIEGDPDQANAEYHNFKKRKNAGKNISLTELDAAYEKAEKLHSLRNIIGKTINNEIPVGGQLYDNLADYLGSPRVCTLPSASDGCGNTFRR